VPVRIERQIACTTGGDMQETRCWLPTYAALCTAFLVFFVVLFSMSVSEPQLFEQSMRSVRDLPGGAAEITSSLEYPAYTKSTYAQLYRQAVEMQARAFNDIRTFLIQNGMEAGIEAVLEGASITLRLAEGVLFMPGTERLLPAGINVLNGLKELFVIQDQQTINIRAYTDDTPLLPGARFTDNRELSALLAAHVLRHLLAQGIEPGRMTATGFGELEPLFPNTTEENRAKNRRIEFALERRLGQR
jgi:chemotaxis protein MotB